MPRTPSITDQTILDAVQRLRASGQRPTVRAVRAALGGVGGHDRVARLLKQALGPAPATPSAPPESVLSRFSELAPDLWRAACADARGAVAADVRRLEEELAAARREADDAVAQAEVCQASLAEERAERERLAGVVDQVAAEAARVANIQQVLCDSVSRHSDGIADLRATISGSGEAHRHSLLEMNDRWMHEIQAVQGKFLAAEVAGARAAALLAQREQDVAAQAQELAAIRSAHAEAQARIATLEAQRVAAAEHLAAAQQEIERLHRENANQAQRDALARTTADRLEAAIAAVSAAVTAHAAVGTSALQEAAAIRASIVERLAEVAQAHEQWRAAVHADLAQTLASITALIKPPVAEG